MNPHRLGAVAAQFGGLLHRCMPTMIILLTSAGIALITRTTPGLLAATSAGALALTYRYVVGRLHRASRQIDRILAEELGARAAEPDTQRDEITAA